VLELAKCGGDVLIGDQVFICNNHVGNSLLLLLLVLLTLAQSFIVFFLAPEVVL